MAAMARLAVCLSLVACAGASENGGFYECDSTRTSGNRCFFKLTSDGATALGTAVQHNIDRTAGADNSRVVASKDGQAYAVTPRPWTNGDKLMAGSVTGDVWYYTLAFELVAPLRDLMMYNPENVNDADWAKWTKAFVDCKVKEADEAGDHGTAYSVANVKQYVDGTTLGTHHNVLKFLEESAIDLVCLMTGLDMPRCDTIRAAWGISKGTRLDCWMPAYRSIYGSNPTVTASDFTTLTQAPNSSAQANTTLAGNTIVVNGAPALVPGPMAQLLFLGIGALSSASL